MSSTSRAETTASIERLANSAIFLRISGDRALSERHISMSGAMPMRLSSLTECWVGLVLSSPACPM